MRCPENPHLAIQCSRTRTVNAGIVFESEVNVLINLTYKYFNHYIDYFIYYQPENPITMGTLLELFVHSMRTASFGGS